MRRAPQALANAGPVVLVLASGRGERFAASGGAGHKLRALLAGHPVLEHTLAAVRASGLRWHLEDGGHPAMGDSIAAAVRATCAAPGWLVLPGDLPLIAPHSLRTAARALALPGCSAAAPLYRGQRAHPVAFGAQCRSALLALQGAPGAASVLQEQARQGRVRWLELDDAGSVADVDTVQDLARAARMLAARADGGG